MKQSSLASIPWMTSPSAAVFKLPECWSFRLRLFCEAYLKLLVAIFQTTWMYQWKKPFIVEGVISKIKGVTIQDWIHGPLTNKHWLFHRKRGSTLSFSPSVQGKRKIKYWSNLSNKGALKRGDNCSTLKTHPRASSNTPHDSSWSKRWPITGMK